MEFKIRSLKFIGFCCFLCWILHLLINSCIPIIVNGPLNVKNLNVKNDYGNRLSTRPSHEARATHIIVILLSYFVTFYSIYIILTIWMTLIANQGQWMVNISVLVASCFPTFSPFELIINDTRVSRFCFACRTRKTVFPNLL
ncbi:hypothetical protein HPG69_007259 [Diceros bicornis minor]|uniref:Vomeronasal type-1 receptor n=1 Tax=Diceros bicornis minor TaxID=77932 RepID=A0A7J7FP87_DICBM|nr:hypothetical protein HPG69_007259 [Diceros bicornis minor]